MSNDETKNLAQRLAKCEHRLNAVELQLRGFGSPSELVTKSDLLKTEVNIMSAISEFAAKQAAFNARQATAIDGFGASLTGLAGDVDQLNKRIEELQNSPGDITPDDQVLLDALTTQGEDLATKLEDLVRAIGALDALTPPTPPAG